MPPLVAVIQHNIMAQFYTAHEIDRDSDYTLGLDHNSSRGDIDGVQLDNIFSNSELVAAFKKRDRDWNWGADIGFQHQLYNWYGLPEGRFDDATAESIDERQNYFMGEAAAHFNVEESFFKRVDLKYRRFWGRCKRSGENRAILNAGS